MLRIFNANATQIPNNIYDKKIYEKRKKKSFIIYLQMLVFNGYHDAVYFVVICYLLHFALYILMVRFFISGTN